MTWWKVLLGVVMLVPALLLVIGLYVAWLIRALDLCDPKEARWMSSDEKCMAALYWIVHFLAITALGVWLLGTGLGW